MSGMVFADCLDMQAILFGCWGKMTLTVLSLPVASDTGRLGLLQLRIAANGSHSILEIKVVRLIDNFE
jgi:hypothetical protein